MGLWPLKRYIFYVQCVLQIDPTKENKKRVIASSFFPTPRIPMALQPAANLHMNLGCVTIEASGMGCKRRGGGGGQGGGCEARCRLRWATRRNVTPYSDPTTQYLTDRT